jgi:hypothetical protein
MASPSAQECNTSYLHPAAWCTGNGRALYSLETSTTLTEASVAFFSPSKQIAVSQPRLDLNRFAIRHLSDIVQLSYRERRETIHPRDQSPGNMEYIRDQHSTVT